MFQNSEILMWDAGHRPAPITVPRHPIYIDDLAVSGKAHGPMARVAHVDLHSFPARKYGVLPRRHEQGFTMIELIVAVTIVALMAVALFTAFRISLNSWSRGTATIDANQRHRTILDLVKKQMTGIYAVMTPIDLQAGGAIYPIFSGSSDNMQFISVLPLRFQDNPGLTVASYEVVRDHQGVYSLVESEEPFLGLTPIGITDRMQKPSVTPIFENLTSFTFEYLDPGNADRPAQWIKEWNTREMMRLPEAISMTMIAKVAGGQTISRHLVVPILAKPFDPRLRFVNPLEARPRS